MKPVDPQSRDSCIQKWNMYIRTSNIKATNEPRNTKIVPPTAQRSKPERTLAEVMMDLMDYGRHYGQQMSVDETRFKLIEQDIKCAGLAPKMQEYDLVTQAILPLPRTGYHTPVPAHGW